MDTQPYRHRHFIVLPAFLLLVGMNVVNAGTTVFSNLSYGEPHQESALPNGMYGTVNDAQFRYDGGLELISGTALLKTDGIGTLRVEGLHITFINGAVHLTKNDSSVTIAAITSPVIVSYNDERMVVPIGMQWDFSGGISPLVDGFSAWVASRTPAPLPGHFFEQQISASHTLSHEDVSSLPELRDQLSSGIQADDAFLFPASRAIASQQRLEDILGYIRFAIEQRDRQSFLIASARPDVNAALYTPRGREVLADLLSTLDSKTPLATDILRILSDNEAVWTVALFHPKYRDVAWSFTHIDASMESRLTYVFVFPYSLYASAPVSDFVFDRYRIAVKDIADSVDDSTAFIEHLFEAQYPSIQKLSLQGYPQRAEQMRRSLIEGIESVQTQTDIMKKDLAQLHVGDIVDVSPLPTVSTEMEQEEVKEIQKADVVALSPAEVENKAYQLLQDADALFTVETNIAAFQANTARITGVYFSGSTEDRKATFTLNVFTGIVSDIEINEQSNFPYNPSFESFIQWVSR